MRGGGICIYNDLPRLVKVGLLVGTADRTKTRFVLPAMPQRPRQDNTIILDPNGGTQ